MNRGRAADFVKQPILTFSLTNEELFESQVFDAEDQFQDLNPKDPILIANPCDLTMGIDGKSED